MPVDVGAIEGQEPGHWPPSPDDRVADWLERVTDVVLLRHWLDREARRAARRALLVRRALARFVELTASPAPAPPLADDADDIYLGIEEVSLLIHRSVSWIRHAPPDAIPGRRQHCPGGRVEWSKRALLHWIRLCTTP